MSTAADQIAAVPKKIRAKATPKICGVPDCRTEVAAGAKLRLTVLEPASTYPSAIDGKISTCKPHRKCVGFEGYSPEIFRGTAIFQSCGDPAKVFYLGRSFCESCHNVYLEALVAQCKPRLTTEQIDVVRQQIVNDNFKKTEVAVATAAKVEEAVTTAAPVKKAAAAAPAAPAKKKVEVVAATPKIQVKKPATPAPDAKSAEPVVEASESEDSATDTMETEVRVAEPAALAPPPVVTATTTAVAPVHHHIAVPVLDEFEEMEKAEAIAAQVQVVVKDPLKTVTVTGGGAAAPKTKKVLKA